MNIKFKKSLVKASLTFTGVTPVLHVPSFNVTVHGHAEVEEFIQLVDGYADMAHNDIAINAAHEILMLHRSLNMYTHDPKLSNIKAVSELISNSKLYSILDDELQFQFTYDGKPDAPKITHKDWGFIVKGYNDIRKFLNLFDIYHSIELQDECGVKAARVIVELQRDLRNQVSLSVDDWAASHNVGAGKVMVMSTPVRIGDSQFDRIVSEFENCNHKFTQLGFSGVKAQQALYELSQQAYSLNLDDDDDEGEPETLCEPRTFSGEDFEISIKVDDGEWETLGKSGELSLNFETAAQEQIEQHELKDSFDRMCNRVALLETELQETAAKLVIERNDHIETNRRTQNRIAKLDRELNQEKFIVKKLTEAQERSPCNWLTLNVVDGSVIDQSIYDAMTMELKRARKSSGRNEMAHRDLIKANETISRLNGKVADLERAYDNAIKGKQCYERNVERKKGIINRKNGVIDNLTNERDNALSAEESLSGELTNAKDAIRLGELINTKLVTQTKFYKDKYEMIRTFVTQRELEVAELSAIITPLKTLASQYRLHPLAKAILGEK